MVADQQVALLRQRQMEGKKQQTAAAMMSERWEAFDLQLGRSYVLGWEADDPVVG